MTLEDLKKDKNEIERKIDKLIVEFVNKYDVKINNIELNVITSININGEIFTNVASNIKIDF